MKTCPGFSAAAIRALSRDLATRLEAAGGSDLRAQPGRLFFPKYTHELSPVEGHAPDGLSADYMALAARLNASKAPTEIPDLLAMLLRTVQKEISRARIVEGRLIEMVGREP